MTKPAYDSGVLPQKECLVCGKQIDVFSEKKNKSRPNAVCPYCHSYERQILKEWFDSILPNETVKLLHFAPEDAFRQNIEKYSSIDYWPVDINPKKDIREVVDITKIPFNDNEFDFIVCNHVLEHVADDKTAMSELYRVLKYGGKAMINVPIKMEMIETLQDDRYNTEELRKLYYGQGDHLRFYGADYVEKLKNAGFKVMVLRPNAHLDESEIEKYGLKRSQKVFICEKCCEGVLETHLNKKQSIIKQGSPECFEGFPLRVHWDVTSHCNFRCSYCFDAGKGYKKDFCTLEQAETAIKHLASANRPSYQVGLLGGEPTTHPHLAEIITLLCQYLGDRLEMLQIITNGSFSESQMKAILKAGEQVKVKLIISVHLEYMGVERVVELVKQYSSRTRLHIALMFHPELIDKAKAVADALCDLRRTYPFSMKVSMLREPPKFDKLDSRYTQEHFNCVERIEKSFGIVHSEGPKRPIKPRKTKTFGREFLVERDENGSVENYEWISIPELKKMTGNVFTGMTCCAGTNVVRIKADGLVRGMICGLDSATCNIFEENPFMREDWIHSVLCTKNMCGCEVNYRIPKFRSSDEAQKFIAEKKLEQKILMSEYLDNKKK